MHRILLVVLMMRKVFVPWLTARPTSRACLRWCSSAILAVVLLSTTGTQALGDPTPGLGAPHFFRRLATCPVFLNTSVDETTVAEIVAAEGSNSGGLFKHY
jgi:hypothetical protein